MPADEWKVQLSKPTILIKLSKLSILNKLSIPIKHSKLSKLNKLSKHNLGEGQLSQAMELFGPFEVIGNAIFTGN